MTNIDIIKTSCKIFGLYFIIQMIVNLRDITLYVAGTIAMSNDNYGAFIIVGEQILQAIFNFIIGIFLIVKSDWITSKLKLQKNWRYKVKL